MCGACTRVSDIRVKQNTADNQELAAAEKNEIKLMVRRIPFSMIQEDVLEYLAEFECRPCVSAIERRAALAVLAEFGNVLLRRDLDLKRIAVDRVLSTAPIGVGSVADAVHGAYRSRSSI